jgi:hypothetical protein
MQGSLVKLLIHTLVLPMAEKKQQPEACNFRLLNKILMTLYLAWFYRPQLKA